MYHTVSTDAAFENLRQELRRGSLVLAVLAKLQLERYGYTLRRELTESGMEIDENTLYPLLRRLETQGLLVSEWREEDKRNKRFYHLSPQGHQTLSKLRAEWQSLTKSLEQVINQASEMKLAGLVYGATGSRNGND